MKRWLVFFIVTVVWVGSLFQLVEEHEGARLDIKSDNSKQVFNITNVEPVAMYKLETYSQHLGYWVTIRKHIDDYVIAETRAKISSPMFGTIEMRNVLRTKVDGMDSFEITLKGEKLNCKFKGKRVDESLIVEAEVEGTKQTLKVPYEGNPFLAGFDVLRTPKNIKIGSNWKMDVLNPLSQQMEKITVVVTKRESVLLRRKDYKVEHIECLRIEAKTDSMSLTAWVDKDNLTIKQIISIGTFEITSFRLLDENIVEPFDLLNKDGEY